VTNQRREAEYRRESFFASLECELLDRSSFPERSAAQVGTFDYTECWYNPHRRHSALGMLSPLESDRHSRQAQLLSSSRAS
jgi:putative transposase